MKKWSKNLKALSAETGIIRFDRSPEIEEEIEGYVVATSKLFVMLHTLETDLMNLNGYTVLRREDIRRYRVRDDYESFLERALKLKGIQPVPRPQIDLSSFPSLLLSANSQFPLITIHKEIKDAETCFIGKVQEQTDKSVLLNEINPAAQWKYTRRYKFKHITRVEFGGGYEDALNLVSQYESQN